MSRQCGAILWAVGPEGCKEETRGSDESTQLGSVRQKFQAAKLLSS
jgi:hypothetical protein